MIETEKKLRLKKLRNGYAYEESNDAALGALYHFLTGDYGYENNSSFREWINDPNQIGTASNSTFLEKEGDNIIIGIIFLDDEEAHEKALQITVEGLNRILDKWEELCKKMPGEIIMTRYNDKIFLKVKD